MGGEGGGVQLAAILFPSVVHKMGVGGGGGPISRYTFPLYVH